MKGTYTDRHRRPPTRRHIHKVGAVLAVLVLLPAPDVGPSPTPTTTLTRDIYGFSATHYDPTLYAMHPDETLYDVLNVQGWPSAAIQRVREQAAQCCGAPAPQGALLVVYRESTTPRAIVYRADVARYVVFDTRDSVAVYEGFFKPLVRRRYAHGEIGRTPDSTLAGATSA